MRFDPQRLSLMALCILDEAAAASYKAPVQHTLAIRLALAYLYSAGRGVRALFDGFWDQIADRPSAYSPEQAGYVRGAQSSLSLCYRPERRLFRNAAGLEQARQGLAEKTKCHSPDYRRVKARPFLEN